MKKKEPLLFKASLVTRTLPMPSLEELPILLKASLGSSTLPSATSYMTANHIEDSGVGSVIGMSMFDSHLVIHEV